MHDFILLAWMAFTLGLVMYVLLDTFIRSGSDYDQMVVTTAIQRTGWASAIAALLMALPFDHIGAWIIPATVAAISFFTAYRLRRPVTSKH